MYKTLIQTDIDNTVLYERLKNEFKDYRGSLRKFIRKAKRDYYTQIFNRHKNDIKNIRNLKKQWTHEFLINDEMISDPIIIANKFNQYFSHIGSTLADKIPAAPHFNSYLKQSRGFSILFSHRNRRKYFSYYYQAEEQSQL